MKFWVMKKQILLKKISFCKINLSPVPCSMRYQTQFESFFTITSVFQISSEKDFEHPRSKSVSITSSGTRRNSKNSRHSDSSKSFRSNQNSKGSSPCNIGQKKLNTKEIAREMFLHCLHGICIYIVCMVYASGTICKIFALVQEISYDLISMTH